MGTVTIQHLEDLPDGTQRILDEAECSREEAIELILAGKAKLKDQARGILPEGDDAPEKVIKRR